RHNFPHEGRLTIIAQDPSVRVSGRILTAQIEVPAEALAPGPRGYRVNVVDYDTSSNVLYEPATIGTSPDGSYDDPFDVNRLAKKIKASAAKFNSRLVENPKFHAQNTYALVMRTLARFEFALGRRVSWGSGGHQLHVAPHAFAEANAFYSR